MFNPKSLIPWQGTDFEKLESKLKSDTRETLKSIKSNLIKKKKLKPQDKKAYFALLDSGLNINSDETIYYTEWVLREAAHFSASDQKQLVDIFKHCFQINEKRALEEIRYSLGDCKNLHKQTRDSLIDLLDQGVKRQPQSVLETIEYILKKDPPLNQEERESLLVIKVNSSETLSKAYQTGTSIKTLDISQQKELCHKLKELYTQQPEEALRMACQLMDTALKSEPFEEKNLLTILDVISDSYFKDKNSQAAIFSCHLLKDATFNVSDSIRSKLVDIAVDFSSQGVASSKVFLLVNKALLENDYLTSHDANRLYDVIEQLLNHENPEIREQVSEARANIVARQLGLAHQSFLPLAFKKALESKDVEESNHSHNHSKRNKPRP
jgi:hypothetical protein